METPPELYLIGRRHRAKNSLKIYELRNATRREEYRQGTLHPRDISYSELVQVTPIPAGTEFEITFVPSTEDFQRNHLASSEIAANGRKELTTTYDIGDVIGF
jgi:hypothetical protein